MIASIALWVIISFAAFAILMILMALCTPMKLSTQFDTEAIAPVKTKIGLIGGLISIPISPGTSTTPSSNEQPGQPKPKHLRSTRSLVRLKKIAKTGPRLIRRILKQVRVEALDADIIYGFSDPSDTGIAFGLLTPFTYAFAPLRRSNIILQPNFQGALFRANGAATIRVIPIMLSPALFAFAWSTFVAPKFSRLTS